MSQVTLRLRFAFDLRTYLNIMLNDLKDGASLSSGLGTAVSLIPLSTDPVLILKRTPLSARFTTLSLIVVFEHSVQCNLSVTQRHWGVVKSGRSARQEFVGAISAACIALFDSTGDCVFIESTATSVNPMFSLRPLLVAVLVVIAAGQDLPPPCDRKPPRKTSKENLQGKPPRKTWATRRSVPQSG
uniref:Uncharacterized protein n=1 Tax=Timema bartmani TaxID=61472 RepID=A0A7R9HZJ1_9NEOP|nr:unnamed protein product [Timema bartmani]